MPGSCLVPLQRQKRKRRRPSHGKEVLTQLAGAARTRRGYGGSKSAGLPRNTALKSTGPTLGAENAVLSSKSSVGREDSLQNHASIQVQIMMPAPKPSESPGGFVCTDCWAAPPRFAHSRPGWGPRICICSKFPGGEEPASPRKNCKIPVEFKTGESGGPLGGGVRQGKRRWRAFQAKALLWARASGRLERAEHKQDEEDWEGGFLGEELPRTVRPEGCLRQETRCDPVCV